MKLRGLAEMLHLQSRLSIKLIALLLVITIVPSCLKQTMEAPADRKLTIAFTPQTLQMDDIDSGAVIFQKQNTLVPYYYRFQKVDDHMEIDLEDISTGSWTANMIVYSKKDNNNRSNQFNASLNFVAEQISGILVLAPSANATSTVWKKSQVLSTPDNEIVAVVPLDVTDPTFEIRVKGSNWDEVSIERAVYKRTGGMNELLGDATWSCTTGCFGADKIIFNKQAFAVFAEQNKTRSWNNADVTVVLKDNDANVTKDFYFTWNKE